MAPKIKSDLLDYQYHCRYLCLKFSHFVSILFTYPIFILLPFQSHKISLVSIEALANKIPKTDFQLLIWFSFPPFLAATCTFLYTLPDIFLR